MRNKTNLTFWQDAFNSIAYERDAPVLINKASGYPFQFGDMYSFIQSVVDESASLFKSELSSIATIFEEQKREIDWADYDKDHKSPKFLKNTAWNDAIDRCIDIVKLTKLNE